MGISDTQVVIVGGGAAGIAAGWRLRNAKIDCLIIEARSRLGGRAWTVRIDPELPVDLGCGWLHSADRNPWAKIAEADGLTIDKTPPPWMRPTATPGFPEAELKLFISTSRKFHERHEALSDADPDVPASAFLAPGNRWNNLINAASTYISGAELDKVSARDLNRYDDSGVNWRVAEGYGTAVATHGADLPVTLGCAARRIDHSGRRLHIETIEGTIMADAAIITLPTNLLAGEAIKFLPALPEKTNAATGLPLGHDDKLFLSLSNAEEFEKDSRLFGRNDRSATGVYHMRMFGRPLIECYYGGTLAAELEAAGEPAFFEFAVSELVGLLGNDFAKRVKPIQVHRWGIDPFSRGAYSYAVPGKADCRAILAAPVDNRLFFAGEACSLNNFSTAHGAHESGIVAADQFIAARAEISQ